MKKSKIIPGLIPLISAAILVLCTLLVNFGVFPLIYSLVSPSDSFNYPLFALLSFSLILICILYFSHQLSLRKIRKEGKVCLAQIVGKTKLPIMDGEATYFHGVGIVDGQERDFILQIYPFTKTKIGGTYSVLYRDSKRNDKCFISADEILLTRLFYSYFTFHLIVSVILSFFV